jgi:hypothetical protein
VLLQKHLRASVARGVFARARRSEVLRAETNSLLGGVYNSTGLNAACGRTRARVLSGPGGPGPPVGCFEVCRRLAAALRDGVPTVIALGLGTALIQPLDAAADDAAKLAAAKPAADGLAAQQAARVATAAASDEAWGGDERWSRRRPARCAVRPSHAHGLPRPHVAPGGGGPLGVDEASRHRCALLQTAAVLCADPRGRAALVQEVRDARTQHGDRKKKRRLLF